MLLPEWTPIEPRVDSERRGADVEWVVTVHRQLCHPERREGASSDRPQSKDLQYPSSSPARHYATDERPSRVDHNYYVYLLTDKSRTTLYVGMTNDIVARLWQHRNPERASFTQRYHCVVLVRVEHYSDVNAAIAREKQLKGWRRDKKIALIESDNPRWVDLAGEWV